MKILTNVEFEDLYDMSPLQFELEEGIQIYRHVAYSVFITTMFGTMYACFDTHEEAKSCFDKANSLILSECVISIVTPSYCTSYGINDLSCIAIPALNQLN